MTKQNPQIIAEPKQRVANDASKLLETFGPGDVSHQGDIIFVGIVMLPKSARLRKSRQLADGDTQGSRHIAVNGEVFDAQPEEVASLILAATLKAGVPCEVEPEYIGPVYLSPATPTADDITHPEHGNQGFPAGAVIAICVQRNLDAEERAQRVRD